MNVSSLQEVKDELKELSPKELLELCISLAKYKKDNKEYRAILYCSYHYRGAFFGGQKNL